MVKVGSFGFAIAMLCVSHASVADSGFIAPFVKHEFNDTDSINSVGIEALGQINNSNFYFGVSSALANAHVAVGRRTTEDYLSWDTGFKFGYFSDVFVYGEVGVDMFEFIALAEKDDCDSNDPFDSNGQARCDYYGHGDNDIDAYAGMGVGFQMGNAAVSGFVRLRSIDSASWRAESSIFSGVELSVRF